MNDFWMWFSTGIEHILDIAGYDHILFVTLLVLAFPITEWKKLLVLITAFTVGHSIALATSIVNNLALPQSLIELAIALTILFSALYQLYYINKESPKNMTYLYVLVICFGLIHGLGFSFLLKAMLGKEESVFLPLLYFNLGLEVGQIIIVVIVLLFFLLLSVLFKLPFKIYKLILVCIITLVALKISVERFSDLF